MRKIRVSNRRKVTDNWDGWPGKRTTLGWDSRQVIISDVQVVILPPQGLEKQSVRHFKDEQALMCICKPLRGPPQPWSRSLPAVITRVCLLTSLTLLTSQTHYVNLTVLSCVSSTHRGKHCSQRCRMLKGRNRTRACRAVSLMVSEWAGGTKAQRDAGKKSPPRTMSSVWHVLTLR